MISLAEIVDALTVRLFSRPLPSASTHPTNHGYSNMNYAKDAALTAFQESTSTPVVTNTSKSLIQDALEANKHLQHILIQRAEQLESKLKEADQLLARILLFWGAIYI